MKTIKAGITILLGVLIVSGCNTGGDEVRRPPRERWLLVSIQASVESLDLESRLATLKGPAGNLVTIEVGEGVERLDEIEIGDVVTADYYTYLLAEFRDPTPEEEEEPFVILAESGKAPEGFPPGAAVGAVVRAVVTVEMINESTSEVTIKGPRGKYLTVPVEDLSLLKELKVGEVGVLTYAEALALSLDKVKVE